MLKFELLKFIYLGRTFSPLFPLGYLFRKIREVPIDIPYLNSNNIGTK